MALFVARHQHSAERCPEGDPQMGPMLLDHVSTGNVSNQHRCLLPLAASLSGSLADCPL
jgi:hypothetical protein